MSTQAAHWPIVGHRVAVDLLSRAARTGQVGHAYLLSGPERIGRGTLARTFARALVCTSAPELRPCGECSACRRIERGLHPDVAVLSLESQAAEGGSRDSKNTQISIETIRELRGSISLRPMEANWRVAILGDVERFSLPAYDALLKTLEEPPPFVVLILIATDLEAVPETIRSRCRQVPLDRLSRDDVTEALIGRGVEPAEAATIASITRGRIGQSFDLAGDREALAARREAIETGLEMVEDPLLALGGARRLSDAFRRGQRPKVEAELDLLVGLWRDMLLIASGCPEQIVNADFEDRLTSLSTRWGVADIHQGLKATYEALFDLGINVQPRLALDRMVTQWPVSSRS